MEFKEVLHCLVENSRGALAGNRSVDYMGVAGEPFSPARETV